MVANGFMGVGLGITVYYLSTYLKPMGELKQVGSPLDIPPFLCIVIFAMEAIGVVSGNISLFTDLMEALNQIDKFYLILCL